MCYKQTILYNPYIPDSLQFAEVKPGKFGMAWKSSAVRYFILPQCGAVQGFSNGHGSCIYIKNSNMCYKQTILYNPYIPDSLQFAEVKPGKFGMAWKSSAVRYFILPQCGAVQGFSNGHGSCRDLVTLIIPRGWTSAM